MIAWFHTFVLFHFQPGTCCFVVQGNSYTMFHHHRCLLLHFYFLNLNSVSLSSRHSLLRLFRFLTCYFTLWLILLPSLYVASSIWYLTFLISNYLLTHQCLVVALNLQQSTQVHATHMHVSDYHLIDEIS